MLRLVHYLPVLLFTLHDLLSLFLITQTRTSSIPIFLLFSLQLRLLGSVQILNVLDLAITSVLLQYSSFFIFGGSNAISSVDLSNAYNGVSGYNVVAVGLLTFVSNWAGPIWWVSGSFLLMSETAFIKANPTAVIDHFAFLTLFTTFGAVAVMVACTLLREHLFIWTVFSPKFLYMCAWVVGHHFVVNGLIGCGIFGWLVAHPS